MTYQNKTIIKMSDLIIPKYYNNFNDIVHTHQIYTSGRAGTKSSRGALRAVRRIINTKPGSVVILRKFHNKLKKTVFNECKRAILGSINLKLAIILKFLAGSISFNS